MFRNFAMPNFSGQLPGELHRPTTADRVAQQRPQLARDERMQEKAVSQAVADALKAGPTTKDGCHLDRCLDEPDSQGSSVPAPPALVVRVHRIKNVEVEGLPKLLGASLAQLDDKSPSAASQQGGSTQQGHAPLPGRDVAVGPETSGGASRVRRRRRKQPRGPFDPDLSDESDEDWSDGEGFSFPALPRAGLFTQPPPRPCGVACLPENLAETWRYAGLIDASSLSKRGCVVSDPAGETHTASGQPIRTPSSLAELRSLTETEADNDVPSESGADQRVGRTAVTTRTLHTQTTRIETHTMVATNWTSMEQSILTRRRDVHRILSEVIRYLKMLTENLPPLLPAHSRDAKGLPIAPRQSKLTEVEREALSRCDPLPPAAHLSQSYPNPSRSHLNPTRSHPDPTPILPRSHPDPILILPRSHPDPNLIQSRSDAAAFCGMRRSAISGFSSR